MQGISGLGGYYLLMKEYAPWSYHNHILSQIPFPLVLLLLNQWCTPPLRLQGSDCSTFPYYVRCP